MSQGIKNVIFLGISIRPQDICHTSLYFPFKPLVRNCPGDLLSLRIICRQFLNHRTINGENNIQEHIQELGRV